MVAALRLRPGRRLVLVEAGDFPTDAYIGEAAARLMGAEVRALPRDDLLGGLSDEVALIILCQGHYRTAALWDMAEATEAAHAAGALILFDLSHATGAVEVALYKYLHGGPGAPAYAFVARRHQAALDQPISGWMGHARPFAFEAGYEPSAGMGRMLSGTPPILAMAALEEGVRLVAEAGAARCAAKARALSDLFIRCLEAVGDPDIRLLSPGERRGGHVTFAHPHAFPLVRAMAAAGVVGDFRAPDGARFGFAPLGLSFADVVEAARRLALVLGDGRWDRPEYRERPRVT